MTVIKFSILIPVYNVDRYLSFCLDSICSQSYTNFEVIAVNDGSTDQSAEILQKYADKDKRIVVINSENKGVSAARNIAIQKASGDYVWMVDADDLIAPDALLTLSNVIQKTSPDIVTFRYQKLYKNKKEPQASSPNCEQQPQEKFDFFRSIFDKSDKSSHYTGGYVWLRVFKTSLIQNITFNESMRYYEDEEFFLRIYRSFKPETKIVSINEKLYCYRKRLSSLMNSNRCVRLFSLYQFQRRSLRDFPKDSRECRMLDYARLVCLLRLMQIHLTQNQTGVFSLFRKVLLRHLSEVPIRLALPYLFGKQIACSYAKQRAGKTKRTTRADSFWE